MLYLDSSADYTKDWNNMWTLKTKDIPALHSLTTWIFVRNSVSLSFPVRFPALIHNTTSHRQAVNQFKWKVLKENAYTAHFKTLCGGNPEELCTSNSYCLMISTHECFKIQTQSTESISHCDSKQHKTINNDTYRSNHLWCNQLGLYSM